MQIFTDFEGTEIRLTDERIAHIRIRHPRVFRIEGSIAQTLSNPDFIEPSISDPEVRVYFKQFGQW